MDQGAAGFRDGLEHVPEFHRILEAGRRKGWELDLEDTAKRIYRDAELGGEDEDLDRSWRVKLNHMRLVHAVRAGDVESFHRALADNPTMEMHRGGPLETLAERAVDQMVVEKLDGSPDLAEDAEERRSLAPGFARRFLPMRIHRALYRERPCGGFLDDFIRNNAGGESVPSEELHLAIAACVFTGDKERFHEIRETIRPQSPAAPCCANLFAFGKPGKNTPAEILKILVVPRTQAKTHLGLAPAILATSLQAIGKPAASARAKLDARFAPFLQRDGFPSISGLALEGSAALSAMSGDEEAAAWEAEFDLDPEDLEDHPLSALARAHFEHYLDPLSPTLQNGVELADAADWALENGYPFVAAGIGRHLVRHRSTFVRGERLRRALA